MIPKMKAHVIINPAAGQGQATRLWPAIEALLQAAGVVAQGTFTQGRGDGIILAHQAWLAGSRHFLVLGGDGTINETINGLFQENKVGREIPTVGFIPCGTGSDLARSLGIARDPMKAASQALQALKTGARRVIDMGWMANQTGDGRAERYFANVAGLGLDGAVTRWMAMQGRAGRGQLAYLRALFAALKENRNTEAVVSIDDQPQRVFLNSIFVCNGNFFGNGMRVGPTAAIDDGWFDIAWLENVACWEVIWNAMSLCRGTYVRHPKVKCFRAKSVKVEPAQPMPIEADGEWLQNGASQFRILPKTLGILVS
jgi:YegS/Rv2252/BmrU family lipid kinase